MPEELTEMLRTSTPSANAEVEIAVRHLLTEDARFDDLERRTSHRDQLVRPVRIELPQSNQPLVAVTRNISTHGICVLTDRVISEGITARISVHCLETGPTLFLAECRWGRPYGIGWFISGWHFVNVLPSSR